MENDEIKRRFRMDSPYQMGGFGRQYTRIKNDFERVLRTPATT